MLTPVPRFLGEARGDSFPNKAYVSAYVKAYVNDLCIHSSPSGEGCWSSDSPFPFSSVLSRGEGGSLDYCQHSAH